MGRSALSDTSAAANSDRAERLRQQQIVFKRVLATVLILVGLYHWASIVGITSIGPAPFPELSGIWQWATINLAVSYLVAAVGLWILVSWGLVVWIYAAVVEIAMYTVFAGTFGLNLVAVFLQLALVAAYAGYALAIERAEKHRYEDEREARRISREAHPVGSGRFTIGARQRLAQAIASRRAPGEADSANSSDPPHPSR